MKSILYFISSIIALGVIVVFAYKKILNTETIAVLISVIIAYLYNEKSKKKS